MSKKKPALPNLGTKRFPIDLGQGSFAYRRNGHWRYRSPETIRRFGRKFVEATDHDLIMELESRGYQILSRSRMRGSSSFAVPRVREDRVARNTNSVKHATCGATMLMRVE